MILQSGQIPTAIAALALVAGLIWLSARFARSAGLARSAPREGGASLLAIEDTLMLDRVRRLHLVRCAGRELVVLTGGNQDQLVFVDGQRGTAGEGGA